MRVRTEERQAPTTIVVGESYTTTLKQRLAQYQISQGMLAREAAFDAAQISRYMNQELEPRWGTIVRIENAITRILARRQKPEPTTLGKRKKR